MSRPAMTLTNFRTKEALDIVFHRDNQSCYATGRDAKLLARLCEDVTIRAGRATVPLEEIDNYLDALSAVGLRVMLVADPTPMAYREAA